MPAPKGDSPCHTPMGLTNSWPMWNALQLHENVPKGLVVFYKSISLLYWKKKLIGQLQYSYYSNKVYSSSWKHFSSASLHLIALADYPASVLFFISVGPAVGSTVASGPASQGMADFIASLGTHFWRRQKNKIASVYTISGLILLSQLLSIHSPSLWLDS